jgi:protoporphyrinogen oxidase
MNQRLEARNRPRWAVIGGGLLGMTIALRLAQRGARVTLIERSARLGGLADAWRVGDVTWDRHYHVTLLSDTFTRGLLTELGLERDMRWVETRSAFYTDGRFHSMSNSLEFLSFPPLRLIDKVRLAATIVYASRIRDWRPLERIPVEDWLRRWSGDRTFETIWLPLLRAKLGEGYRDTSAAFIWATIARMYAARRTGLKREMFGYLPGGYGRVHDALRDLLVTNGVELRLGAAVRRVTSTPGGRVSVDTTTDEQLEFDRCVVTVAAPVAAAILPDLDPNELEALRAIEYQGVVCASVVLDQPLGGYYVTNITDDWVPFTAVIEMSALVDRAEFGGRSLAYLPKYLPSDDPAFERSDDEWRERLLGGLFRMYPNLDESHVVAFRVSRERFVHARSTLGYSDRLPPRRTSIPNVHLVNSAHIVNGTLNVNETIRLADEAHADLFSDRTAQWVREPDRSESST